MNKAILTLPMMPIDGKNYGKFVTPIICEMLSNIFNCDYYQCINLLDSFNNREVKLQEYIKSLDENNINYNKLWYDKDNIDKFLNNIHTLINKGYIHEIETNIYKCDCGIVEIEENKVCTCNPNNLKFIYENEKMICKYCHKVCKKYKEKVLAFIPNKINLSDIHFLPNYLNKDIKTYEKTVLNSYVTISRKRDTGIKFKFNGTNYNIDIDFLWATYLNTFNEKEKIVVSGNRMVYQLFLVAVLEKCLKPDNNTILLGTPYISNIKNILDSPNFVEDEKLRKLFVLFNMKWSKKEIMYDENILKYLRNISLEKRNQLYDIMSKSIEGQDFYDDTNYILKKQIHMQECVKKLKLERG